MARQPRGFDLVIAQAYLARRDRKLAPWLRRIGPLDIAGWRQPFETVDALARSILYQQLSGKAAATIVGRVEVATASTRLTAEALMRVDDPTLRACGVSGNKTLALRDLAHRAQQGEVPSARRLVGMDDAAIIETLTAVRGIGRWTVEMLLMFRLGRPDILPIDDLGVRKGAQRVDKRENMLTPKALAERGEVWGPYRTLAGFYLWRIADSEATVKPPVKRAGTQATGTT